MGRKETRGPVLFFDLNYAGEEEEEEGSRGVGNG